MSNELNTEKKPYELLIRWNQEGTLAGAHVQYRYVTSANGNVVAESIGNAEPLVIGEYPLADLLNEAQAVALSDNTVLQNHVAHLQEVLATKDVEIARLTTELSSAKE